jgi:hypothetical protein
VKFNYEIKPSNFFTLPDEKQMSVIGRFFALLSNLQKTAKIFMIKEPLDVQIGNEIRRMQVLRTYLSSDDSLENVLESLGYEYSVVLEMPSWKIKSEKLHHLNIQGDYLAKCFTLYSLPANLGPAWVHSLLVPADMISITISPIQHDKAVGQMNRYTTLVQTAASKSLKMANRSAISEQVLLALTRQETKLFSFRVVAMILAKDIKTLKITSKSFRRQTGAMLAGFDGTISKQGMMLKEGWGKSLFIELGSCAIFYPFVSADMLEVPNGITLGVNKSTGAPVIYDYTQRDNYNILLLATSGAGKSVTAKVILSRLMKKYPDCLVFIIDPQGEYDSIAQYLDILPMRVTQQKELGFDPFKLFESNNAAEILGDITRAKDTVRKEFRALASKAKSVFELYEIVSDEAKPYLKDLVEGHISDILKGDFTKMSDRAVISLRGTYGQDESVAMLLLLALGKIWKKILEKPPRTPKILLIDEGWMLFKMPSAGKFLDSIARIGRKLNVIFLFVTQRPEDIIDNEYGRGIADNAGTKILLQNTEQASQKIAKAMSLSSQEMDMLKTFSRGEALFLTKDYRLRIQITPSREELKIFSTTPMENI